MRLKELWVANRAWDENTCITLIDDDNNTVIISGEELLFSDVFENLTVEWFKGRNVKLKDKTFTVVI